MSGVRRAVIWFGVSVLVIAAAIGLLFVSQRRLIYLPDRHVPPPPGDVTTVTFVTADGIEHVAWVVSPAADPMATVLVFNGNAGDKADRMPLARALAGHGLAVVLFDYRGYGDTAGRPTEAGLVADARAARAMVDQRSAVPIVYFGESLGAAVAVALAEERRPAALVLRSPFASLLDIARVHYGPVPGWMLLDRWPVAERVSRLDAPLLVIAGTDDRIVPPSQSRSVAEAARGNARLVTIDAGHNDPALAAGDRVALEVGEFIAGILND